MLDIFSKQAAHGSQFFQGRHMDRRFVTSPGKYPVKDKEGKVGAREGLWLGRDVHRGSEAAGAVQEKHL